NWRTVSRLTLGRPTPNLSLARLSSASLPTASRPTASRPLPISPTEKPSTVSILRRREADPGSAPGPGLHRVSSGHDRAGAPAQPDILQLREHAGCDRLGNDGKFAEQVRGDRAGEQQCDTRDRPYRDNGDHD